LCHDAGTVGGFGYSEQDVPKLIQVIEQQKALLLQQQQQQQQLYLQQQALLQSQSAAALGERGQAGGGSFAANMLGAAQPVAQSIPFADQQRLIANARISVSACYALATVSHCTSRWHTSLIHLSA
jgi:hypothetical protein